MQTRQTPVAPPPVLFHGTSAAFDAFEANPRGIFFAERYTAAAPYARIRAGGARRVMAAALNITNPWVQIAYADDVPYSVRIDQSVSAVAARGYDSIYVPKERVWIATREDQVSVLAQEVAPSAFIPHLQQAVDDAQVGFHFEEGGCWGMALALKAVLGGDLVLRDGFTHAYVRAAGSTIDWQGVASFDGGRLVSRDELLAAARDNGVLQQEVEADVDLALSIIDRAHVLVFAAHTDADADADDATLNHPHEITPKG